MFLGTETCDEVFGIAKELFEDLDFIGMRIGRTYGDFVTTFGSDNLSEYMRKQGEAWINSFVFGHRRMSLLSLSKIRNRASSCCFSTNSQRHRA